VGAKIEYLKKYFPHLNHHIATGNIVSGAIIKLKASNLYNLFVNSKIFSALSVGPRSQIILRAKNELHVDNGDIVVIGDTLNDFKAANEAKIPSIILTSTEYGKTIRENAMHTMNINWSTDELVNGIYNAIK
jgi:phosphoglycolate phosphatase-like HAD superfamily hydrolase